MPKDAAGLRSRIVALVDSSKAARLTFDNVELDADAVIGEVDGGWAAAVARARMPAAPAQRRSWSASPPARSAMTLDYLKQRKQFGKLIGEFQALQHRAAHLYAEIEIARAAAFKAAQLLDSGDERGRALRLGRQGQGRPTSPASRCSEGVQMHGGIGMTDEHDIGLYHEARGGARASCSAMSIYHRERVAELSGY